MTLVSSKHFLIFKGFFPFFSVTCVFRVVTSTQNVNLLLATLHFKVKLHFQIIKEFFKTGFLMLASVVIAQTFTTHLLFEPAVSVGAPDGNKFLFANENKLVQNSWPSPVVKLLGKHSLAIKVGDEHKKFRRIFTTFFNPDGLQTFVPRIEAITLDHMAKHWEGKDTIRGLATLKEFTFAVAADLFASVKDNDPRFRTLHNATEDFLGGILQIPIDLPGAAYHKGRLGRDTLYTIVETIIAERKQELEQGTATSRKDLLSVLLTTRDEEGVIMSDDAVKDNMNLMLFAGHDTSSTTMSMVLKYLYLNPECLTEVIQEQREIAKDKDGAPLDWNDTRKMKYTWQAVQETLRLQPPVTATFRVALQDFQYGGYTIPKGWKAFWSNERSHCDPKYFPNPEKFNPSRFEGSGPPPYVFVPFGGGPHMCLGNEFARTEMMVFLHHIVLNFEWKMVDPDEPISVDPMPLFKRGLELQIRKKQNL
ncbi:hypothetical protein KC19_8G048800 [Ceratodon purpureus]|uniref:Cytochrome P450 n=1 Tax=Ceratodon purpureus TaxID=3225 RepID=A0A8T0GXM5_CERPU|nr:hypothetical protein KC19_8G048800 [Ceratodon purpureus]